MNRHVLVLLLCLFSIFLGMTLESGITRERIANAEKLIGLRFSDAKRDSMIEGLNNQLKNYENIRKIALLNEVSPALLFNPIPAGMKLEKLSGIPSTSGILRSGKRQEKSFRMSPVGRLSDPTHLEDLAFYSVRELGELVRTRKVSSMELTRMYLDRLKKYGPQLECVITLTEDLAIAQARRADAEISAGKYRGPLHGIPYGAKDLLATKGIRTTWGSVPYKDQIFDEDATVIRRLEEAGAVLVAKLTLGELAWGDVWFGGTTRNPWNIKQGSSGSSAGSASATAAGLVAFSIGSETWGSIVSPSTRCGATGLRPTYGRVSRKGAMALSWSMDKLGPICRTAEDCAIVLRAICGPDGQDQTVYDVPFNYDARIHLLDLRVGYLKAEFDSVRNKRANNDSTLAVLERLGVKLMPVELPKYPVEALAIILSAEAGAAFDELTRNGQDDLLVRQIKNAWPNEFRLSRFIPAVEYIQANRVRTLLIRDMGRMMEEIDMYVAPSFGDNLLLTNLTGHPCVVVPNGFNEGGTPTSISFIGRLFDEGKLLAVAKVYQDATGHHLKHPVLE